MVSMMAYGAIGAALGATIRISFDRASGWLRQLRVTPVPQTQVVAVDVAVGALLTLPSLLVVALVGRFVNGVELGARHLARAGRGPLGRLDRVRRARPAARARPSTRRPPAGPWASSASSSRRSAGCGCRSRCSPSRMQVLAHALPSYWYAELGRDVAAGAAPSATAVLALVGFTAVFAVLAVVVARRRPLYAVAGLSPDTVASRGPRGVAGSGWAGRCPGCCSWSSRSPTWCPRRARLAVRIVAGVGAGGVHGRLPGGVQPLFARAAAGRCRRAARGRRPRRRRWPSGWARHGRGC